MGANYTCADCGYSLRLTPDGHRRCGYCAAKKERALQRQQAEEDMVRGKAPEPKP